MLVEAGGRNDGVSVILQIENSSPAKIHKNITIPRNGSEDTFPR